MQDIVVMLMVDALSSACRHCSNSDDSSSAWKTLWLCWCFIFYMQEIVVMVRI